MKCCSCGHEIPDQAKFCAKCGAKQNPAGAVQNTEAPKQPMKPAEPKKEVPKQQPAPKKKGSKVPFVILLCVILCAAAGFGGYMVFQTIFQKDVELSDLEDKEEDEPEAWGKKKSEAEETAAAEEVEEEEETEPVTVEETTTQASLDYSIVETTASALGYSIIETTASTDMDSMMVMQGEYILPDSATKYLTDADIEGLTADELRLARNELYARHGRKFNDEELLAYFNGKSWYQGTIEPNNFDETSRFNDYEKKNLILIKDREALISN